MLQLKVGAKVMLIANIDISDITDRLKNWQTGLDIPLHFFAK